MIDGSWGFFHGWYFLLRLVFPFMVLPYMVYRNREHLVPIFRHYSFCIATVNLLQSVSLS